MRNLGLNGNTINLLVAGGINILQFLAVFPAILYIDKWGGWPFGSPFLAVIFWIGRKPLLRGGSAVMTASHLLCALMVCPPHMLSTIRASNRRSQVFEFGSEWENHPIAAWVAVGYVFSFVCSTTLTGLSSGVYLFTVAYGVSFGPISWVLPNEVFPLSMRGKGAAISTASNWTNNCTSRIHFVSPSFLIEDEMLLSPDWPHHTAINGTLSCVSLQREMPVVTVSLTTELL